MARMKPYVAFIIKSVAGLRGWSRSLHVVGALDFIDTTSSRTCGSALRERGDPDRLVLVKIDAASLGTRSACGPGRAPSMRTCLDRLFAAGAEDVAPRYRLQLRIACRQRMRAWPRL